MRRNPIDEGLRSDHLFLLIGGNAVPNWVAARLLLREGGQLYLVHSPDTTEVSQRLLRRLLELEHGMTQPTYIAVRDGMDASAVYSAVGDAIAKITSGQVGLNYTGGTKVMSVHAYRAVQDKLRRGVPPPIFSYLDSKRLSIRFDGSAVREPVRVAEAEPARLDLKTLFALADDSRRLTKFETEPRALPVAEAIARVHETQTGYARWREQTLRKLTKDEMASMTLAEFPEPVGDALSKGVPSSTTLQDLCRAKVWPFRAPVNLWGWLNGRWLEDYTLGFVRHAHQQGVVDDYAANLAFIFSSFRFEVDVAAVRGYQLHLISCHAGGRTQDAMHHLHEAYVRARQIGGDEACAAMVCMSEDPQGVENHLASTLDAKGRVRVFGRVELKDLGDRLTEWFLQASAGKGHQT